MQADALQLALFPFHADFPIWMIRNNGGVHLIK